MSSHCSRSGGRQSRPQKQQSPPASESPGANSVPWTARRSISSSNGRRLAECKALLGHGNSVCLGLVNCSWARKPQPSPTSWVRGASWGKSATCFQDLELPSKHLFLLACHSTRVQSAGNSAGTQHSGHYANQAAEYSQDARTAWPPDTAQHCAIWSTGICTSCPNNPPPSRTFPETFTNITAPHNYRPRSPSSASLAPT